MLKHALRNAMTPVITLRRARVRHAAVGRGADRADLHHSGLRQADRRRRVQPRLRRRAGRRAGDRHDLHRAQPAGRHRLRAGQSEAARHDRHHAARRRRRRRQPRRSPRARAWRRLQAPQGRHARPRRRRAVRRCSPSSRRWIAPYDPTRTSWTAVRKAPSWAHWFGTDEVGRDVLSPRHLRRSRLAAAPASSRSRSRSRSACRSACWRAMPAAGSTR